MSQSTNGANSPHRSLLPEGEGVIPGETIPADSPIPINAGRRAVALRVRNSSAWPVHVGSHFHFFEVNRRLIFDRVAAFGMRLDIPAGATVRWEPGEEKEVRLVEYAGNREIYGFNGLVNGPLNEESKPGSLERAKRHGFEVP